jgi:thiol-disulfide isomerase/thioredoxin
MSDSASIKTRPNTRPAPKRAQAADDYDDAPVTSRPLSSRQKQAQEYDQYDQYDQYADYDQEDGYYDEDEEQEVSVSLNRRTMALIVSSILVVAVFATAIVLLLNQNNVGDPGASGKTRGPQDQLLEVPVITGFNPTTSTEDQQPKSGSFAPDFQWQEGGKTVSLSSYRGDKPVFVNFWGTWCPPCKAEMPEMSNLYNTHKSDIEMIGVSMGPRDWPEQVLSFVNKTTYGWKFIHDGDYKIAQRYQITAIPSSFFVDKTGKISVVHVGAMTGSMMEGYYQQVEAAK